MSSTLKIRGWLNPYVAALLALPLLVLWRQDNSLFPDPGIDSWVYLGFFRNLVEFQRNLFPQTYYGTRLSWILPGYLAHALFAPVAAAVVLHLAVHSVAVLSLFSILKRAIAQRRAFLAAMLFSLHPGLWRATGWDYTDGAGIAYSLLASALLFRAAAASRNRLALVAAGISLAAMVYTNLYWATFAPLLLAAFPLMARAWRRVSWTRLLVALAVWTGAGFALLTLLLGALNFGIDRHFWFYAPSFHAAGQLVTEANPWLRGPSGEHGIEPWLWFAAVAALLAGRTLLSRPWKKPGAGNVAAALFSGQLLCALAGMLFTQARGTPVLGYSYYASYLLPFVFLVIGAGLPDALDEVAPRTYTLLCAAAALALAAIWSDPAARLIPAWPAAILPMALLLLVTLALSQFLRSPKARIGLTLAWFLVLTAEARTRVLVGPHFSRHRYEAVMQVRSRIEAVRQGRPVRFWYDTHDPRVDEFLSLSSTYLWWFSLLDLDRARQPDCVEDPLLDTVIVTVSSSWNFGADQVRQAVGGCWDRNRLRAEPAGVVRAATDWGDYTAILLRVEPIPGSRQMLHLVSDPRGKSVLEPAGSAVSSLPLASWSVLQGGELTDTPAAGVPGILVRTPPGRKSLAALYPPIAVQSAGRYGFAVRYLPESGHIVFGAMPANTGPWLAGGAIEHKLGNQREIAFWVDLAAGQEVQLALANSDESGDSVSFRMTGLTAVLIRR